MKKYLEKSKLKLSKIKKLFLSGRLLLSLLAPMVILSGCAKTDAKIVPVNDFCEGRFTTQYLTKKDYDNLDEIRKNKDWKITVDLLTDNKTENEKEYEHCKAESN
jgi:hypothetical protein